MFQNSQPEQFWNQKEKVESSNKVENLVAKVLIKLCVRVLVRPPDQELFSGMYIDFMGTDAAIFRSLTRRNAVRSDQHNSKWLSGEKSQRYVKVQPHSGKKKIPPKPPPTFPPLPSLRADLCRRSSDPGRLGRQRR